MRLTRSTASILSAIQTFSHLSRSQLATTGQRQLPLLRAAQSLQTASVPKSMSLFNRIFGSSGGSASASHNSTKMSFPDERSADEWQAVLNKVQFRILREKGTEAPFSGEYDKHFADAGVYSCAGCAAPLYKANHKFKSGCGWPAYFDSIPGAVTRHEDNTHGMRRTEIVCSNCGGHLGHVFKGEGYPTPTDERHCVNSISLKFSPDDAPVQKAEGEDGGEGAADAPESKV